MSIDENKQLIRCYFEAIDAACEAGDAGIIDQFLAPDFVERNPFPGMAPTREGWKKTFMESWPALPVTTWWRIWSPRGTRWWDASLPMAPTKACCSGSLLPGKTSE